MFEFIPESYFGKFFLISVIFSLRTIMIGGAGMYVSFRSKWRERWRVVLAKISTEQLRLDFFQAGKILVLDSSILAAALHFHALKILEHPSPTAVFVTFFALFIWFEIYFYYSHRILHHPKVFFIHRHHHLSRVTHPFLSLSFSLTERLILLTGVIGASVLVSQWYPIALPGFAIYTLVNYILNVNSHLNVELLPKRLFLTPLGATCSSATHHGLHHLKTQGNYGLFTRFLDRWHGTEFANYAEYYRQVTQSRPVEI